jgi:hypothetical protein
LATDMDGKAAMEIGYVSCGRSMPHSFRSFPDFHTLIKTSEMVTPTSFLQVVVIVREEARYRHLRYCGWDLELSPKERGRSPR